MAQNNDHMSGEAASPNVQVHETDCPLPGGPGGPCGPQAPRCLSGPGRYVAESLLPSHDDQAMIVAPCGMVLMANHAMARHLGLERAQVPGQRLDSLHPPHVAASRKAVLDVVVRSGNPVQFQETTGDRIMQVRFMPVREVGGHTAGVFVLETDVTDRKKLDMEKLWLGTAIEQAAEAIIIMDEDFAIQYVNQAFESMTGFSREEMRHRSLEELYAGDVQQEQFRLVAETLAQGDVWTGRTLNRRKDGSVFRCEKTVSPIRGRHGVHLGYVSVWRDVTQEVELERQLRHAQKMEAIGTLAGGIAHDFNNILGPIILHAELVLETLPGNRTARSSLQEILKAAGRARDLIDQILNLSRQREIDEPVPFRLGSILKECVKLLRPTLPTSIEIAVDIGTSEDMILADPNPDPPGHHEPVHQRGPCHAPGRRPA